MKKWEAVRECVRQGEIISQEEFCTTPYVEISGLFHFDTGGKCLTPEWDFANQQGKTVIGCRMADGSDHWFDDWVCEKVAREYQARNGGIAV